MADIKELYNRISKFLEIQGYQKFLERAETLYYDESGNDKHLIIKGEKLNTNYDAVFVLGGIQSEDSLSIDECKDSLGIDKTKELKAKNDLKGSFFDVLKKTKVTNVMKLIEKKDWHIHFNAIQILYYGFVDIIDSIDGLDADPYELKAVLYDILKTTPDTTVAHFKKYKYPNIKDTEIKDFLKGLIYFVNQSITADAKNFTVCPYKLILKQCLENARNQKNLTFIQDEIPHEWVKDYLQFYHQEIITFRHKTLVFDEEKQVQASLSSEKLMYEGNVLCHYSFCDSSINAMIQLSDYIVGILRKYFIFLDRLQQEVDADIDSFDKVQMKNFQLLNKTLERSFLYNPLFINTTISIHCRKKMELYINKYGRT